MLIYCHEEQPAGTAEHDVNDADSKRIPSAIITVPIMATASVGAWFVSQKNTGAASQQ